MPMHCRDFWYIAAASRSLRRNTVLRVQILGEWLAVFRDAHGTAVALQDRCLHRCAPLSGGHVRHGVLQCAYHGWRYDGTGRVVQVPSAGPCSPVVPTPRAPTFAVCEVDDYVYVNLSAPVPDAIALQPFRIPYYGMPGWGAIRLKHQFPNNVTNCVENFVDIPHTAFVHPRIFRVRKDAKLTAHVQRRNGSVLVQYHHERANFGIFSAFLNPHGHEICHTDAFHMPNVTCVDYLFGPRRHLIITSQAIPLTDDETLVYTDLTYNYGLWNTLTRPIIYWQARTIIRQDIAILRQQRDVLRHYGSHFANTPADVIHVLIESIRNALLQGIDPRLLPEATHAIEFFV
jgi:phenylpropionate dioxygenase-like ring-hydroxylating dioxygenase large terminal subunit